MQATINNAEHRNIKTSKAGIFRKIILDLLKSLPEGHLKLILPEGEIVHIGNGQGNINAHLQITNNAFFIKCIMDADIGFAESYMDGDWQTDDLTTLISYFLLNAKFTGVISGHNGVKRYGLNLLKFVNRIGHMGRANSIKGSGKNISAHYDLGNEFYSLWLDKSLSYSGGYFKNADMSLEEAQYQKYDRISKLLKLKPEDKVLEIGSGWGACAIHIAKYYHCQITSITISEQQYKYALKQVKDEGLEDKITIKLSDYRQIEGKFDKIVSIEMLEAVGAKYIDAFFRKCDQLLNEDGLLALQVITCPDRRYETIKNSVDFIQKHIFPGSLLPSVGIINTAINKNTQLTMVDLKDFGLDYARTLATWRHNFNTRQNEITQLGFDGDFIRKWHYYLCYCEAAFLMRNINVMQILYATPNYI